MKVTKERYKSCIKDGNYYESLFKERVIDSGYKWDISTLEDDMYKHIDCYVDGYGVDVKGNRHLDTIWLEYTNVKGNEGWLRGEAHYIAMNIKELDCFSIYKRVDLLRFVLDNVSKTTTDKTDYLMYYTREKWGKKDKIVKVKYKDIKHLELKKL